MVSIADKLFGEDYYLSAFGRRPASDGPSPRPLRLMGGQTSRVGLEDNLYLNRGELAKSNAEQVAKVVRLLTELGHDIATAGRRASDAQAQGPPHDQV